MADLSAPADVPAHKSIDADALRRQLQPWLAARLGDDVEVTELSVPQGQGYSSETFFVDTSAGRFVAKVPPTGETVFPRYDLEAQFRCMQLVREHSDVPAAPVRWYEPDVSVLGRPFYVMERVDGDVPPDNLPYTMDGFVVQASPDEQRRLYDSTLDVLAGLHQLDWEQGGFGFLDRPHFGPVGVEQQLGEWAAYYDWVARGSSHPVPEAALARLRSTLPSSPPPTGLSWGDSRVGNVIYRDFSAVAVLDWEMAGLGPAEIDLAWFFVMHRFFTTGIGVPELPGFPSEDEGVAAYESRLGRSVDDLDWYLLFAAFRYASILIRLYQKMSPDASDDDNLAVQLLASLL